MNYRAGFVKLMAWVKENDPNRVSEIATLEGRYLTNERSESILGSSENTRHEHAQIIYSLNEISLEVLGISFNDLSKRDMPAPQSISHQTTNEMVRRLEQIENKIDKDQIEGQYTVKLILGALQENRINQNEARKMMWEIQAWIHGIQEKGIPLSPDLQEKLSSLTDQTADATQYLQLTLPVIPGILQYNIELGTQGQLDLKSIWEKIKNRIRQQDNPDSVEPM